jgi:hypothetical protein
LFGACLVHSALALYLGVRPKLDGGHSHPAVLTRQLTNRVVGITGHEYVTTCCEEQKRQRVTCRQCSDVQLLWVHAKRVTPERRGSGHRHRHAIDRDVQIPIKSGDVAGPAAGAMRLTTAITIPSRAGRSGRDLDDNAVSGAENFAALRTNPSE